MPCCSEKVSPGEGLDAAAVQQGLQKAAKLAAGGRLDQARQEYQKAAAAALRAGEKADAALVGSAILMHCQNALLMRSQLGAGWPGEGPGLDEQLAEGLRRVRGVKQRVPGLRSLEGQLLLTWSQAVFARPGGRDAAALDGAIEARHTAAGLLIDASVEELPWTPTAVRRAADDAAASGGGDWPLVFEELCEKALLQLGGELSTEELMEAAPALQQLFSMWAQDERMSPAEFLRRYAEAAEHLEREDEAAAVAAACRAPCDGGASSLGFSDVEKALVQLVAKDGPGNWQAKALALQVVRQAASNPTASDISAMWARIAPEIKKTVDADSKMSCGHSCSTCPTREECKVHDALKDIEDL